LKQYFEFTTQSIILFHVLKHLTVASGERSPVATETSPPTLLNHT
jgi:hypothetical protein